MGGPFVMGREALAAQSIRFDGWGRTVSEAFSKYAFEPFTKSAGINDIPVYKRNLGMIFQNYALFPHKTIFDNVAFGLKYRDVPKDEVRERVGRALEMVRLPGVEKRYPDQLSGGQRQRIALARAIVIEPDVLRMDESLSALDETLREEMRREVGDLQQMIGVTIIFVTHDQRDALSMSDKIVVMKDGRKQQEGPPEEVYNEPVNHFMADFLGHSNFLDGVVLAKEKEGDRIGDQPHLADGIVIPHGIYDRGKMDLQSPHR